jgi:hypothetical protein
MPEETTTDVVAQATAQLAEDFAAEAAEEAAAVEAEAPAVEAQPEAPAAPAEPAKPSKAEEIRQAALARRAKLEEEHVSRRQPEAPADPLAQFQREEIRQAIEFRRQFERDPMGAAKAAGMDVSQLYDRMTREALSPGQTQQMSAAEAARSEAEAARKEAQEARAEFQRYREEQAAQARYQQYVGEINRAASDQKAYPHANMLDEPTRVRWAAEEERDMLRLGYQPTPLELIELVEERAASLRRQLVGGTTEEAGARSGGAPKAGKSAGAATTRSSQSLTNDLASQSGPPAEVDYSPEAALKRAQLAARELWSSSE